MALKAMSKFDPVGDLSTWVLTWATASQNDTFEVASFPGHADKSIQVSGNFAGSASIALHGSNDGVNFSPLNDPSSTPIALTAAGIKAVLENTRYIKPVLSSGNGSTAVDIVMQVRLANPLKAGS